MSTNTDGAQDGVITRYKDAPTRTIDAGGTTYAYRELGPRGGIPDVFSFSRGGIFQFHDTFSRIAVDFLKA